MIIVLVGSDSIDEVEDMIIVLVGSDSVDLVRRYDNSSGWV